jgi:iron complex transport system substrate-binding protein
VTQPAAAASPRIVSLIASATEIVHALGLGENFVGRSHECDWPPAVVQKPQLTRPKFKVDGTSADIDRSVQALVADALAVYEVDAGLLESLSPDLIITQDQCAVCAVSLADVEQAVCQIAGDQANVVSLSPHSLADVFDDVMRVAAAANVQEQGQAIVATLKRRLDRVATSVKGQPVTKMAFIEWIEPLMSCGHWMPELIALAGGETAAGETGTKSPYLSWAALAEADPDVILVAPCGFEIQRTLQEMPVLERNPVWPGLRAVANGNVFVADGNAYFNRPGPRLVESAEILAEVLHPESCDFGHMGEGYLRFPPAGNVETKA